MRRWIAGCLILWLGLPIAAAENLMYADLTVPSAGTLVMRVPSAWTVKVEGPSLMPSLVVGPASGRSRMTVSFFEGRGFVNLWDLTAPRMEGVKEFAEESDLTLTSLDFPMSHGYCFRYTHRKPKTGEHRYRTEGNLLLAGLIVSFEIQQDSPAEETQAGFIHALRSAWIQPPPSDLSSHCLTIPGGSLCLDTPSAWMRDNSNVPGMLPMVLQNLEPRRRLQLGAEISSKPLTLAEAKSILLSRAKAAGLVAEPKALQSLSGHSFQGWCFTLPAILDTKGGTAGRVTLGTGLIGRTTLLSFKIEQWLPANGFFDDALFLITKVRYVPE